MPPEKIAELMKKPLVATGVVSLVAEKDAEGKPVEGNKKMTITAYNGGLMNVAWGGYPVGIELSGLKWREDNAVPILCQHKTYSIDAICGQATKVSHDGKTLTIAADFMPVSADAKKVHDLAKAGFKFQASVGVSPSDVIFIEANQSCKLNGEEVKGECYIVRAGTLNEVSIVPLGADGSTQTAIAAAANTKEGTMPEDKNKKPVVAAQPTDTATMEAAAQTAERERVASVIAACKGHDDIMAKAVNEGWTAEKAELECLRAEKAAAERAKIEAGRTGAPAIIDLPQGGEGRSRAGEDRGRASRRTRDHRPQGFRAEGREDRGRRRLHGRRDERRERGGHLQGRRPRRRARPRHHPTERHLRRVRVCVPSGRQRLDDEGDQGRVLECGHPERPLERRAQVRAQGLRRGGRELACDRQAARRAGLQGRQGRPPRSGRSPEVARQGRRTPARRSLGRRALDPGRDEGIHRRHQPPGSHQRRPRGSLGTPGALRPDVRPHDQQGRVRRAFDDRQRLRREHHRRACA